MFDWKSFLGRLLPALLAALLATLGVTQWPPKPAPNPPAQPAPPVPAPPAPPAPAKDPREAIGRLAMDKAFCSATVVQPPGPDGRRTIVSAAHCVSRVGEVVQFTLRSGGPPYRCAVAAIDREADISVLVTDQPAPNLPWVRVAERSPPPGTPVFHAGFGQDKPGNTEPGTVTAGPDARRQLQFRISVSPGDSGGGICHTAAGELLSPVCCTSCLGCPGDVFGGSPERIREMIRSPASFLDLPPARMPPPPKIPVDPGRGVE